MTAVSKNFYFDELNDIVDKYNYTYHQSTKMKPIDVKSNSYVECNVNPNAKDPKLKKEIMLEFQSKKMFLLKVMVLIGQKKFL